MPNDVRERRGRCIQETREALAPHPLPPLSGFVRRARLALPEQNLPHNTKKNIIPHRDTNRGRRSIQALPNHRRHRGRSSCLHDWLGVKMADLVVMFTFVHSTKP